MTQAMMIRYDDGMDTMQLGTMLAKSGYFSDVREAAQAVVKVLAGREMGIGPIAAMTGIYIVKGRVTLSANLMAAQIKRSGKYTYAVAEMTNERCELVYYEIRGDVSHEIGRSVFSKEDAQHAGLWNSSDPWKKTPRNMLFARAMSNGAKWYCPDVFSGPIYTPDELADSEPTYEPPTAQQIYDELAAPEPPAKKLPSRAGLMRRLRELADEAKALNAYVPDLDKMDGKTDEELLEAGIAFRAKLDQLKVQREAEAKAALEAEYDEIDAALDQAIAKDD